MGGTSGTVCKNELVSQCLSPRSTANAASTCFITRRGDELMSFGLARRRIASCAGRGGGTACLAIIVPERISLRNAAHTALLWLDAGCSHKIMAMCRLNSRVTLCTNSILGAGRFSKIMADCIFDDHGTARANGGFCTGRCRRDVT